MRTIKELKTLTDKWAHDRQLDINGKYETQWLKLISEVGELADSVAKAKTPIDDIGDCLVVLSNMELMIRTQKLHYTTIQIDVLIFQVEHYMPSEAIELHTYIEGLVYKVAQINEYIHYIDEIRHIIYYLAKIAKYYKLTLAECWTYAYEEIKNRKGYVNKLGNFIKEV